MLELAQGVKPTRAVFVTCCQHRRLRELREFMKAEVPPHIRTVQEPPAADVMLLLHDTHMATTTSFLTRLTAELLSAAQSLFSHNTCLVFKVLALVVDNKV